MTITPLENFLIISLCQTKILIKNPTHTCTPLCMSHWTENIIINRAKKKKNYPKYYILVYKSLLLSANLSSPTRIGQFIYLFYDFCNQNDRLSGGNFQKFVGGKIVIVFFFFFK